MAIKIERGVWELEEIKSVMLAIGKMIECERKNVGYLDSLSSASFQMSTLDELDLFHSLMMDERFVSELGKMVLN